MEGLTITPERQDPGRGDAGRAERPGRPEVEEPLGDPDRHRRPAHSRRTHEYVYLLHNTDGADTGVSEITALDNHRFVVDERDGHLEPGANKKLWLVDLRGASDIGKGSKVVGATYDPKAGGLVVGGETVENIAGHNDTADTLENLRQAGITPASSTLFLDVAGLVSAVDPSGGYFGHDKVEGVALINHGRQVLISNDNDFGIDGVNEETAPFTLHAKLLPDGQQDDGELLLVDRTKVPLQFR